MRDAVIHRLVMVMRSSGTWRRIRGEEDQDKLSKFISSPIQLAVTKEVEKVGSLVYLFSNDLSTDTWFDKRSSMNTKRPKRNRIEDELLIHHLCLLDLGLTRQSLSGHVTLMALSLKSVPHSARV